MHMIDMTTALVLMGALLACALLSGAMAVGRGRDGAVWFLAGLLLGPAPVLALIFFGTPPQRD